MDHKKIFVFLLMGIFMISIVSAFEFDNVKDYNEETKTVTIKNCDLWLGVCLNKGEILAEYTLTDNTDYCLTDCYAEGTATLGSERVLFQDVEFKNKIGNTKEINDFKWFIEVEDKKDIEIKTYETICSKLINGTEICHNKQNGTIKKEVITYDWKRYNGEDLPSGDYKWRIEGRKNKFESIDWVVSSNGFKLKEWAWWNSGWGYKTDYKINSNVTSTLTNFPAYLEIDTATLITAGKMESACEDLRILNSAEDSELDYEIENSTCNTASTIVWFKHPSLASGNQTVYVYYGNSGASSTSDGTAVFDSYAGVYHFGHDLTSSTGTYSLSGTGTIAYNTDGGLGYGLIGNNDGDYAGLANSINPEDYDAGFHMMSIVESTVATAGIFNAPYWAGSADTSINYDNNAYRMAFFNNIIILGTLEATGDSWGMSGSHNISQDTWAINNGTTIVDASSAPSNNIAMTLPRQYHWQGVLERTITEVRISLIERTTDWCLAELIQLNYIGTEQEALSLSITQNIPIDYYNSTSQDITFNCSATQETGVYSLNLTINGTIYETVTGAGTTNLTLQKTETLSDGFYNWSCTGNDLSNSLTSDIRYLTIDTTPFINFTSPTPIDNYNSSSAYFPVNVTLTETYYDNITFYFQTDDDDVDWEWDDDTRFVNESSFADGVWEYNVTVWTTTGQSNSTETRTITIDTGDPVLSVAYNLTDLVTFGLPTNSTWHYNATDLHIDSCYYNYTGSPIMEVITCNSTQVTNWTTGGSKTLQFCANDTLGNEKCNITSIDISYIAYDQFDNPDPAVEGFDATFNLTVNMTGITTTSANFTINDTIYAPTTISSDADGYYFEVTVEMEEGWGNTTGYNQSWHWNYTIDGITTNTSTSTENITVYKMGIDDCSTYGEMILNFSLRNEEDAELVNVTAGSNFEIDLTLTSRDNSSITFDYSNIFTDDNNPQICIPANVINNTEWDIDFVVGFDSTDHVWEFYYLENGTLDSTLVFDTQTSLQTPVYDLLTADSTSFLFNYFDQDGLAVEDAMVHVYRQYIGSGVFLEVERARPDELGDTIVHLVEEDVIYYFVISQNGTILYTSSSYTALCQTTPCTIQVEASGEGAEFPTDWTMVDDGAYSISSDSSTRDVSLTYTSTVATTFNLTVYKYESDGSYLPINSSISTGTSGVITLDVPQSAGNVSFFASVIQDDVFINSEWVDFTEKSGDKFGTITALFIASLIILTLGLMAVSEGVGTLIFVMLGVALSGFLGLMKTDLSTGVSVVLYLVIAGGILIWKLTSGRK